MSLPRLIVGTRHGAVSSIFAMYLTYDRQLNNFPFFLWDGPESPSFLGGLSGPSHNSHEKWILFNSHPLPKKCCIMFSLGEPDFLTYCFISFPVGWEHQVKVNNSIFRHSPLPIIRSATGIDISYPNCQTAKLPTLHPHLTVHYHRK